MRYFDGEGQGHIRPGRPGTEALAALRSSGSAMTVLLSQKGGNFEGTAQFDEKS